MKKAYIETYGCQMNVNDTEVIFAILAGAGYARTENMEEADLVMANTCSVRDNAEQRIWGRLEVFGQLRSRRPGLVVGIVGCMAERLKDKLLDSGKVDLVVGPDAYRSLPRLLEAVSPGAPQMDVGPMTDVVTGLDKGAALRLLVRSMAPKVAAVDEISGEADAKVQPETPSPIRPKDRRLFIFRQL